MNLLVPLMVCVNNPDNGVPTGRVCAFAIGEAIKLESRVEGAEPKFCRLPHSRFRLSMREYYAPSYGTWVGNWCWDCVHVFPETAAKVLNYVRTLNYRGTPKFGLDTAWQPLWDKWEAGEAFTAADMINARDDRPS